MGLAAGGGVSIDLTQEEGMAALESLWKSPAPPPMPAGDLIGEVRKEDYLFTNLFLFLKQGFM